MIINDPDPNWADQEAFDMRDEQQQIADLTRERDELREAVMEANTHIRKGQERGPDDTMEKVQSRAAITLGFVAAVICPLAARMEADDE